MQEAIRKLSGFPATNLSLKSRGFLRQGYFADIVIFDEKNVTDNATFDTPLKFADGMEYVFVNGVPVIEKSNHTGTFPGRFIKGPGYKKTTK
jgi:N-acyl-D-amino-acid deacylase